MYIPRLFFLAWCTLDAIRMALSCIDFSLKVVLDTFHGIALKIPCVQTKARPRVISEINHNHILLIFLQLEHEHGRLVCSAREGRECGTSNIDHISFQASDRAVYLTLSITA